MESKYFKLESRAGLDKMIVRLRRLQNSDRDGSSIAIRNDFALDSRRGGIESI